LVNLDAWKALPENYRVIFEEAAKGSLVENMAFQNVESAVATKKFLDYGVKVAKAGEGDPAFWSKMEVIVKEVLEDFASKNPDYARVLKSQVDYLKTYMAWKEVTSPFHSGRIPESLENLPEVKDAWLKK
jgi:TRAP-type mannitol/chloroaromatic compound transport system substrate-binding protein